MQLTSDSFDSLLLKPTRWIDVRAPVEFAAGSIPGAVNLPLLTDDERHAVGLRYKEQGQKAAIDLGHELVHGAVRDARISAWRKEFQAHPDAIIYCFRGGLRSQITQEWLREGGIDRPIVNGGYKALRRHLIETIETLAEKFQFEVVTGLTGSGKTAYIRTSGEPFLDLEDLAKHRGSAFGAREEAQPTQIDFENQLAVELLKLREQVHASKAVNILIEDESRKIGRCVIPDSLFRKMNASPRRELRVSLDSRVETVLRDYVIESRLVWQNDVTRFDDFRRAVRAISAKLGGLRTQEIMADLDYAQAEWMSSRGFGSNRVWIRKLLAWYYDPCYRGHRPPPSETTVSS